MTEIDTSAEAVERLASERGEKAAESFMMAAALREHDRDPSGFMLAGEYAANTAATLRALLRERDEVKADIASALATLTSETEARVFAETERDAARVEVETIRRAWLRVIQTENGCAADGACVNNKRCDCAAEQEMLIREAAEARAALAGEGRADD